MYNALSNSNLWENMDIEIEVKDSNGNVLADGDSVTLIRGLKVKGSSIDLKRGEVIKRIRLTSNEDEIECRIGKSTIVLKTCYLKKAKS